MCGIAGFIDKSCRLNKGDLSNIINSISHRGPDAKGIYITKSKDCSIGLGHARLSIIDTSENANQPMKLGDLTITYNGEIYNYKELRKELLNLGHSFRTDSDTEVILASFIQWGQDCVNRFHGMWALAIFDSKAKLLHLSRDRIGVKPLTFYLDENRLIFCSEINGIKRIIKNNKINKSALTSFFELGYISQSDCIYENYFKVQSGSWVTFDTELKSTANYYWTVNDQIDSNYKDNLKRMSFKQVKKHTKDVLIESFNLRTIADVPFGVFLSGGVDSSLVCALLSRECNQNLNTFTIGFDEKEFDESMIARRVSKEFKTNHFEEILTINKAKDLIFEIPRIWDEPLGDSSTLPTYLVSKLASRNVKVCLSADGADELFLGYSRYKKLIERKRYSLINISSFVNILNNHLPIKVKHKREILKKLSYLFSTDIVEAYKALVSEFGHSDFKSLNLANLNSTFLQPNKKVSGIQRLTEYEINNYLEGDILYKVDHSSMANSLESREPFLDQNIVKLAINLPLQYKFDGNQGKSILKSILSEYLPEQLVYKKKQGFGIPVRHWMKEDFSPLLMKHALNSSFASQKGSISNYVLDFVKGRTKYSDRVWRFLMFELWKSENNVDYEV